MRDPGKWSPATAKLQQELEARFPEKEYFAIWHGNATLDGVFTAVELRAIADAIDAAGEHPTSVCV